MSCIETESISQGVEIPVYFESEMLYFVSGEYVVTSSIIKLLSTVGRFKTKLVSSTSDIGCNVW